MSISLIRGAASGKDNLIILMDNKTNLAGAGLDQNETELVKTEFRNNIVSVPLYRRGQRVFAVNFNNQYGKDVKLEEHEAWEELRKCGYTMAQKLNHHKISSITVVNHTAYPEASLLFAEGLGLSCYRFLKYKKNPSEEASSLKTVRLPEKDVSVKGISRLKTTIEAVSLARDLVNEPVIHLTAVQLAKEIKEIGKKAGFSVKVLDKAGIKKLKMGGLLAVNMGSQQPPTFSIMEYKPERPVNKKPIVLVGKGVVYDTGGLSIKPTPNSMDWMKSDMAGAAAVTGVFYAAAKEKLPVHLVGLIPATDNRPGETAYTPGDVIKMHSGMTVEVLNTDAEGRMILADALHYAKKYNPELVIDLATLTGSAMRAVGHMGIAAMATAPEKVQNEIEQAGNKVYERLVWFPLWKEYDEEMKSDIADIKNIGGALAGQITAGKFLQKFTDYPWIHLDIATMAFLPSGDNYRGKNGTGICVRLLFEFLINRTER